MRIWNSLTYVFIRKNKLELQHVRCVWKVLLKSKFSCRWNAFKQIELNRHFMCGETKAWRICKLYDLRSHSLIHRYFIYLCIHHFPSVHFRVNIDQILRSCPMFLSIVQVVCLTWVLSFCVNDFYTLYLEIQTSLCSMVYEQT